jgi:hypothetical protein
MKIVELISNNLNNVKENASAGATSAGSIASVPATGSGSKVGTLFGGTYKQKKTKRTK